MTFKGRIFRALSKESLSGLEKYSWDTLGSGELVNKLLTILNDPGEIQAAKSMFR
jgi:hypothetical protein